MLWHLMILYLWPDSEVFEGCVKGAEGEVNPLNKTIYHDAIHDDYVAALPIHEYPQEH